MLNSFFSFFALHLGPPPLLLDALNYAHALGVCHRHTKPENVRMSPKSHYVFFFLQLLDALIYMHELGVCHRDVKPENVLMCSDDPSLASYYHVKLTDFGLRWVGGCV